MTRDLGWVVLGVEEGAEALCRRHLAFVRPQGVDVMVEGLNAEGDDGEELGPTASTLVVPLRTSRVRAAMTSACRATDAARSIAAH